MSLYSSPKALFPVLGAVGPISVAAAGTATTGATYLQIPVGSTKLSVTVDLGVVGSTPTHALSALQATAAVGTGSKTVAGITGTATTAGTYQFDFDVAQTFDIQGGFNFVQFTLTNGSGSASLVSFTVQSGPSPYQA